MSRTLYPPAVLYIHALKQNTPLPIGRTVIACQRMVERLKATLKPELEALKGGSAAAVGEDDTPTAPNTTTTPKHKADADDLDVTPTKRGRKKKIDTDAEPETEVKIKEEPDVDSV